MSMKRVMPTVVAMALFAGGVGWMWPARRAEAAGKGISVGRLARVGTVDARYQSYNIEMVEVTGGRFWRPYADVARAEKAQEGRSGNQPAGLNPALFEYRPPLDLRQARLRKLAAALGPAYVRVSGTWANTTYFDDSGKAAPEKAPAGFNGVLTRQQWKGVVDFARAVNAKIVTSVAVSAGTRGPDGVWTPKEASKLVTYTRSIGGSIAAAEYMNEPTFATMGGAPKGYDAAAYARDVAVFRQFARREAPGMVVLGPGSVGEGVELGPVQAGILRSEDLLEATGDAFDAFSYHFYGAVSSRCGSMRGATGHAATTTAEAALSDDWLGRTDRVEAFYAGLRDRFEPGKPMWLTETGQAACGGDLWASTFLDSFRYLNQLGSLAKKGVQVVAHNTLSASDYALLDEKTLEPRPNYWAALLWRRLMGTTVLDAGTMAETGLHVYAHCLAGKPGGVALMVLNTDRSAAKGLAIDAAAERYTLTADELDSGRVKLNGRELRLGANDALPGLRGESVRAGEVEFAPASITFLAVGNADNESCR
jgi:heparanase 1